MNVRTEKEFLAAIETWDANRPISVDYETNGRKVWQPGSRLPQSGSQAAPA